MRFNPEVNHEDWMVEDLRSVSLDLLFCRLVEHNIRLDKKSFLNFADQMESPEELAEVLTDEGKSPKEEDQIYLLTFELWRRLLPERSSLSILCDELDHQIDIYYQGQWSSHLQELVDELSNVLDDYLDASIKPKSAIETVQQYCSYDLELFLYDFILDILDYGSFKEAKEYFDEFFSYYAKSIRFAYLDARFSEDFKVMKKKISDLLDRDIEEDFLLDILDFLSEIGSEALFSKGLKFALKSVKTKEDFIDLIPFLEKYQGFFKNGSLKVEFLDDFDSWIQVNDLKNAIALSTKLITPNDQS